MKIRFACLVLVFVAGLFCTQAQAQDLRATVEGPIFNNTHIVYYCNLFDKRVSTTDNYEVAFLFDNVVDPLVPTFTETSGNGRVALEEKYIIGKMRKQLKCKVRSYLKTDTKKTTVLTAISESFVNLGVVPDFIRSAKDKDPLINCKACVYEGDKYPLKVDFETTVPFRCANGSFNCEVLVKYTTSKEVVLKQPKDGAINPCVITLVPSALNGKSKGVLNITAVKDDFNSPLVRPNFVKMTFPSFPDINFDGTILKDNWNNFTYQLDVKHHDNKKDFCTVSGYSQVTTFDKHSYQMKGIGQFKYVDSTEGTPFDVQLRHWPCSLESNESCVCGVAVQESGVDVVVDMCVDGTPHFISSKCLLFPTDDGIKVIANDQQNRFAIILPSGNSVYGSIVGRQMSLDVYVTPDKKHFLTGLCGLYDGYPSNEIVTVANLTLWRIPPGESIFDGKLKPLLALDDPTTTVSSEDKFCSCKLGVKTCKNSLASFSSIDQYDYGMTNNVQPKVSATSSICSFRRDDKYFSGEYKYYSWADATYSQTWSTTSGISEAQAEAHCRKYLWDNSQLKPLCAAVTNVDTFIAKCKKEIQISGFLESVVNIEAELGRYCIFQGAATATVSGFKGLGNLENLNKNFCEAFSCSFNGKCAATRTCGCDANFIFTNSKDCSYNSSGAAIAYTGPLCDLRTQQCDHLMLSSQDIHSIFPECNFKIKKAFFNTLLPFILSSIKQQGSVIDENSTMCYTPLQYRDIIMASPNRALSSSNTGTPILFDLSAYNDKSLSSSPVPALLYDSYCYDCKEDLTCTKKILTDGCTIKGHCFKNNTRKPKDSTLYCNIALSLTAWSIAPIPETTTTAATTTNTATTPPKTAAAATKAASTTKAAVLTKVDVVTTAAVVVVVSAKAAATNGANNAATSKAVNVLTNAVITSKPEEDEGLGLMMEGFLKAQNPTADAAALKSASAELVAKLKTNPKCSGFEDKMKASKPTSVPALTQKENMEALVLKYCAELATEASAGVRSGVDSLTEELDNLIDKNLARTTTTTTTTTTIAPRPNLGKDVVDWLKNLDTTVSADAVLDLMNKNSDCVDSEVIASIRDAPTYDKTVSLEANVFNLVALYCKNNSVLASSLVDLIKTSPKSSTPSMGAIIGGVVGGLLGLGLLALLCCICGPALYRICCPVIGAGCHTAKCVPQTCVPVARTCAPVARTGAPMCHPPAVVAHPPAATPGYCTTNVTTIVNGGDNFKPYSPKDYCGIATSGSMGGITRYKNPHIYLRPNYGCRQGDC